MDRTTATTCTGCGAEHAQLHCPRCGFDRRRSKLTWRLIGSDLAHHIANWEAPVWHTIRGLSLRPGATVRAFLDGPRRSVVNPLKYCLVMGSLTIAAGKLFGVQAALPELPPDASPEQVRMVEAAHRMNRFLQDWSHVLTFLLLPLLAVLLRGFFPRQQRSTVEHLAFCLFTFGHAFLLQSLMTPFATAGLAWALTFNCVPVAYFVWAAACFYRGGRVWIAVRALLADVLLYTIAALLGILAVRLLV